nr:MAG TPA: hypothetical protein [Caudoviricetes sp.]
MGISSRTIRTLTAWLTSLKTARATDSPSPCRIYLGAR